MQSFSQRLVRGNFLTYVGDESRYLVVDGCAYLRYDAATLAVKRAADVLVALVGLLLAAPIFIVVAVLIKLDSRGPVFFRQVRVGLHRRRFLMWKFRKMRDDLPQQGPLLTSRVDGRCTRVGRLLERTKLDELPQLINVLLGDMSVVGPRPEVEKFVEHYPRAWDEVLSVKPGIFGPNQIRLRNESELYPRGCEDMEQHYVRYMLPGKLSADAQYARENSVDQDVWLILRGVWVTLAGTIRA